MALVLFDSTDESSDFKMIMEELGKQPLEELLQQYKEATHNRASTVTRKIAGKLSFWRNIRICCYALAGFIFILGTVFQILSMRND